MLLALAVLESGCGMTESLKEMEEQKMGAIKGNLQQSLAGIPGAPAIAGNIVEDIKEEKLRFYDRLALPEGPLAASFAPGSR